ncbi:MAG TPA: hypothetical protein VD948_02300 [Rhodothermales bacterium]|nr:hypothetical protein [Rhodothermales bacterium]
MKVPARFVSNDTPLNLRLASAGVRLIIVYENQVRDDLARGELVRVLEAFTAPFAGYYLYYHGAGPYRPRTVRSPTASAV